MIATVIVSVLFFLSVMAKAPVAGKFMLTAGFIALFRALWFVLMAVFAFITTYENLKKS